MRVIFPSMVFDSPKMSSMKTESFSGLMKTTSFRIRSSLLPFFKYTLDSHIVFIALRGRLLFVSPQEISNKIKFSLEQSLYQTGFEVEIDVNENGSRGKPRHGAHGAA